MRERRIDSHERLKEVDPPDMYLVHKLHKCFCKSSLLPYIVGFGDRKSAFTH